MTNGRLRLDHIRELHPNLTMWEALDLLEFARKKTIRHTECYGNGEIIYPMWLTETNKPKERYE